MKKRLSIIFISCAMLNIYARNPGLSNDKYSDCYFNATIQCLSHLESLTEFLTKNQPSLSPDNSWKQYIDIINGMKIADPTKTFNGHVDFIRKTEKKFKVDSAVATISGLFEHTPPEMMQNMLNFAFAKEKRIYHISPNEEPSFEWSSNFIFGNNPTMSAITNVEWGNDQYTRIWLSRNKFTKDGTEGYLEADASKNHSPKHDFIQNIYDTEVQLDLTKIKTEIRERIQSSYKAYGSKFHDGFKILRPYPEGLTEEDVNSDTKVSIFIEDLKNEPFWQTLGFSTQEAIKFFSLSNDVKINLERKLIPPVILILNAEQDYPNEIKIEKKLLIKEVNSNIQYGLKAIIVEGFGYDRMKNEDVGHAWAYAKENDDLWTEYDDDKTEQAAHKEPSLTAKITSFDKFESLNGYLGYPSGRPLLLFYELDQVSKTAVESYYNPNPMPDNTKKIETNPVDSR